MQNLHVIHGRPSWSSTFIIAAISSCGMFSPLRFKFEGEGDARSCYAYATELATGEVLTGPRVSIAMAKAEGWYGRNGSKWPTMPDVMLTYRAAAFFGRIYAANVLNGLSTADEAADIGPAREIDVTPGTSTAEPEAIARINAEATATAARRRGRPSNAERAAAAAPAAPVEVTPAPATAPAPAHAPAPGVPLDPAQFGDAIVIHDDAPAPAQPVGEADMF
jgi:hypothetical protein